MLPIPKELQNQKAIPFMEWCVEFNKDCWFKMNQLKSGTNLQPDIIFQDSLVLLYDMINKEKVMLNFLSQSFTPEMLTEYFEEKYVNRDNNYFYRFKIKSNKTISFNLGTSPMYLNIENDYKPDKLIQLFPKSLNDLITLCTLADAGVELTWKGEK